MNRSTCKRCVLCGAEVAAEPSLRCIKCQVQADRGREGVEQDSFVSVLHRHEDNPMKAVLVEILDSYTNKLGVIQLDPEQAATIILDTVCGFE